MIYRFQSAQKPVVLSRTYNHDGFKGREGWWYFHRYGGAFVEGALQMNVPVPNCKHINPRARFYFTEEGYRCSAASLIQDARERGQILKVVREKNPERSRVAYRDRWQVAVLPPRKKFEKNA